MIDYIIFKDINIFKKGVDYVSKYSNIAFVLKFKVRIRQKKRSGKLRDRPILISNTVLNYNLIVYNGINIIIYISILFDK